MYAFVGKKIRIEEFDATVKGPITRYYDDEFGDTISSQSVSLSLDHAYHCSYQVTQPVFNRLSVDTISFNAYSHYVDPGFDRSDYVLLYLSKDSAGTFYMQKYQYDLLKKRPTGFVGLKGQSIKRLFNKKRVGVFSNRDLF